MKRRYRYGLLAAGILLAAAALWFRHQQPAAPATLLACADLQQGCGDERQRLHIRFDRMPHSLQPFGLSIEAPQATAVFASFAMRGMEMGLNRYRLLQQPDGRWTAEVTLPVCVQGRSDWLMLVEVIETGGERRYRLEFSAG